MIRFLVDAVGFEEVVYCSHDGVVEHAQLTRPSGGGVVIGSVRHVPLVPCKPGGFCAYVVTDNPGALFARVASAGAEIIVDLYEMDHGSRDFALRDPEGSRRAFGSDRGEPWPAPSADDGERPGRG